MSELLAWRHPRPEGAAGRCIGAGTALPVHWRRAKRLARRIQRRAQRERLPHVAACSPLRRCADVGRWLRRWGWQVHLDAGLMELDFGAWDGRHWEQIDKAAIDAWVADFAGYAPGGGESLAALLGRVQGWTPPPACRIVIGHGGWMLAWRWLHQRGQVLPTAAEWPRPPAYGACWSPRP
ncbi:histidine phosphatase family protein [Pelomonas sp. KK5]|uniref:histidine phosphatase family protein n=1 Tax=Pelomonas sp. KK5 TaxID=1855730 RepID=UPI00097C5852|nr:histidine phosphatase family protein [Pelomonas sp. KK5]